MDKYGNNTKIVPAAARDGLKFQKVAGDVYRWLGFEAVVEPVAERRGG